MQHEQEFPKPDQNLTINDEVDFIDDDASLRSKTSLRMLYEAQSSVIQKQIGDLETVRVNLGLSQRKISQLLLVDPSSWTRWTRKGDQVPPHIWRALQWYLTLKEKIPGLTPQYFIGQDPKVLHEKALKKIDEEAGRRVVLERTLAEKEIELRREILKKESELKEELFEKETRLRTHISILERKNKKDRRVLRVSLIFSAILALMFVASLVFR